MSSGCNRDLCDHISTCINDIDRVHNMLWERYTVPEASYEYVLRTLEEVISTLSVIGYKLEHGDPVNEPGSVLRVDLVDLREQLGG